MRHFPSPAWQTPRALATLLVCSALLLGAAGGRSSAESPPSRPGDYLPIILRDDGRPAPADLDRLAAEVLREAQTGRPVLVMMIHGFNTSFEQGRSDYRVVARRLQADAGTALHPIAIGVHWPSDPGPLWRWLPQAVAFRFTAGLGFPNAVRNPYLEKVRLAHQVARTGVRSLLLRLHDELPQVPVHLLLHSLGSDIALTALAPESPSSSDPEEIEAPQKELRAGLVVMAGADLDQDVFSDPENPAPRRALDRGAAWWITLPRAQAADGALELRRGAGRHDALGNRGPTLLREDFDRLMARRGLVLDRGPIPIRHALTDYYDDRRVRSIVEAMRYLRAPEEAEGRRSLLAQADRVLGLEPSRLEPILQKGTATEQLYAAWRLDPKAMRFGPVKIAPESPDVSRGADLTIKQLDAPANPGYTHRVTLYRKAAGGPA